MLVYTIFHCSLKTVDLEDSPWYYTFSYTWGNPHAEAREGHAFTKNFEALNPEYSVKGRKPILCDGKLLYINRNLYDAFCDVPKDARRRFINRKNEPRGWSRLHVCVIAGKHEQVRQLLRSGIDLNIADNENGDTALNWATRMGKSEMVKLLVEAGARIDLE
jgi:ankyrin repeat protein